MEWTTAEGVSIPLKKLTDSHLLNIKRFIERKAKEGVNLLIGTLGWDVDEGAYADEYVIYGAEVKRAMNYKAICSEIRRRGLK